MEAVRDQLDSVIAEYAALIDSHILMLRDTMLFNKTLALIEEEMISAAMEKEEPGAILFDFKSVFPSISPAPHRGNEQAWDPRAYRQRVKSAV